MRRFFFQRSRSLRRQRWRLQEKTCFIATGGFAPGGRAEFCSILTNSKLTIAGNEGLWDALLNYHASGLRAVTAPSARECWCWHRSRGRAEILRPVHRVVRNLRGFQAGEMVRVVRENFFFEDVTHTMPRLGGSGPHFDP